MTRPIPISCGWSASRTSTAWFTRRADPIDVHMLISAFCFFRVSNRHTFSMIFRRDLSEEETMTRHKGMIADAVINYLKA